jgi:hypothetical protein
MYRLLGFWPLPLDHQSRMLDLIRKFYSGIQCTLQRHNTENSKQIFPEKEMQVSDPISTFHMCL